MDPMAILGLIQLGASLIGGFRAAQEAERQQRLMERAMDEQTRAMQRALNLAAQIANKDITGAMMPYYSALQGRAMQAARAQAGAAGLTGSGLEAAAVQGIVGDVNAAIAQNLLQYESQRYAPLLQALGAFSGTLGEQARLRGAVMQQFSEAGPDLSWLPILLSTNPNLFNFSLPNLSKGSGSNLGGGGGVPATPTP